MTDVREREKIAREIEKTSESIHKKRRALKTGRIEEDIALDRHFKPVIKPLQIVDSPVHAIKRQSRDDDAVSKRERKEEEEEEEEGEKRASVPRPRVSPMIDRTSTADNHTAYQNRIDDRVIGQCF